MKTLPSTPAGATKTLWGVICLALAATFLLAWVWSGNLLGLFWTLAVLAVAGAGTVLTLYGVNETQDSLLQTPVPEPASTPEIPAHLESMLAEITLLAWRISKRAQKEAGIPRPIVRNADRIIEALAEQKVETVSYEGRRIDIGSRVKILDVIEGEEVDRVVVQHEPEIQVNGKLVHKALVSVGKGKGSATPPK